MLITPARRWLDRALPQDLDLPSSILIEQEFYDLEDEAKSYLLETSRSILALAVHRPGDIARSWLFRYFSSDLYLTNGFDNPIKIDSNLVTSTHYHVDLSSRLLRDHEAPDLDIPKKYGQDILILQTSFRRNSRTV